MIKLPVPHPLDFDWRFTSETINDLFRRVNEVDQTAGGVCFLGAPTLFRAAVERSMARPFYLVDASVASVQALQDTQGRIFVSDLLTEALPHLRPAVVVSDPPWYEEFIRAFLWAAAQLVEVGGSVLLSFPPVGTRPHIEDEWKRTQEFARQLGLTLRERSLSLKYISPPFEQNALRAAHHQYVQPDWRPGVLVLFEKTGECREPRPSSGICHPKWSEQSLLGVRWRFRLQQQPIVCRPLLVEAVRGAVLDSVSRRDPRRAKADVWTSGNRIFACLHTMYVDKPMQGHGLMQAIARVNRVFKDKEGGLIVDYLGLADQLKKAMANYTQAGGKGQPTFDQDAAVRKMLEHFDVVKSILHGFDYSKHLAGKPTERVQLVKNAADYIIPQENGKSRYLSSVSALSRAFALSVPHEKAMVLREEIGFFQTVRGTLIKTTLTEDEQKNPEVVDSAVRQIVSRSVVSDEVIDIFSVAGLGRPDISILSDEFLEEVRRLPQKNLAIEALRKLLNDQLKTQSKKNLVQSRLFSDMLQKTIQKYQNRSLDTAEIIAELVNLAKNMREAQSRGDKLKMSDEEIAFYDALEVNDSAVKVLGDETLRQIALELVDAVRKNASIDWTVKESVRAKMRAIVKRILRAHGYPPDKQEHATLTVLAQAELLCKDWVA
jgi:type I restriction enzyme R subunit